MISLTINAESVADLQSQIRGLLGSTASAVVAAAAPVTQAAPAETTAPAKGKRGRPAKTTEARQISEAPEDRQEPETTDSAEVEAQDTADEQAEVEQTAEEPKLLTHDDIRNALGAYVKKYGMAAAQEDGPKVLRLALKDEKAGKISEIPDDQDKLKAVLAGVEEMTAKNPFKREEVKQ